MRASLASSLCLAVACVAGGCATNPGSGTSQQTMRVTTSGGSTDALTITRANSAARSSVAAPIDRVWRALPAAYDSLGIALTTMRVGDHYLGNEGMKAYQRLRGVALSKYIDCGQAQIGPSADTYDVFLTVTTKLEAASPTETTVYTTVTSAAKPLNFGQEYSTCRSKGTLEQRLAELVTKAVAAK